MTKRKRTGTCTYCGLPGPITSDHVPPKNLWLAPRPTLITVPACLECNSEAGRDDEYFRLSLLMVADTTSGTPAHRVLEHVMEKLNSGNQNGFKGLLRESVSLGPAQTRNGLFIPKVGLYDAERARLERVAQRTIRGLNFSVTQKRLSPRASIKVLLPGDIEELPGNRREQLLGWLQRMLSRESRSIGDGTFRYWRAADENNPLTTLWILRFYESLDIIGLTTDSLTHSQ